SSLLLSFLYCHASSRALSSFSTRRSSDLPGIDHISFTGSPQTGQIVQQAALANFVPVTLELGGKSPQLVFSDADIDAALPVLLKDRKSTRLNSSHVKIAYAVFCLKKKNTK